LEREEGRAMEDLKIGQNSNDIYNPPQSIRERMLRYQSMTNYTNARLKTGAGKNIANQRKDSQIYSHG
jgi:hypothetical protein